MLAKNPLRTDFNSRYQEIIAGYNLEKDRVTIEETFAKLMKFVGELDEEKTELVFGHIFMQYEDAVHNVYA